MKTFNTEFSLTDFTSGMMWFLALCLFAAPLQGQSNCSASILQNGSFQDGLVGGDINGTGHVDFWSAIPFSSPQAVISDGCADPGALQMWGNQVVGEGIEQSVNFEAGKSYDISFCGLWMPSVQDNVRIRFRAINGSGGISQINYLNCSNCEEMWLSPILDLNWNTYTFSGWTPSNNYNTLVITIWNDYNINDGDYVSWARIDDLCIEESSGTCGDYDPTCLTNSLDISTGLDLSTGGMYTSARYDANWSVVETEANITTPRQATVISPFLVGTWGFQNGAEWLSYYEDYLLFENNPVPDPPHAFERCFCICENSNAVTIDISVMADDDVDVNLMDEYGAHVTNLMVLDNSTGNNYSSTTASSTTIPLSGGKYCIRADVRNTDQVAMGFNLKGTVSGGTFVEANCCRESNIVYGAVYCDADGEGFRDFRLNNNPPEEGIATVDVDLCDLSGTPLFTETSDQFGFYQFVNVPPGDYLVKVASQITGSQTQPASGNSYTITVGANTVHDNKDFGFHGTCAVTPVSVDNALQEATGVSIYPNPTSEGFYLSFETSPEEDLTLRLMNLQGQLIRTSILRAGQNQHFFDLGVLPASVYIVVLQDASGRTWREKIVKQ